MALLTLSLKARKGMLYALALQGKEAPNAPAAFVNYFSYQTDYAELPPTMYAFKKLEGWCASNNIDLNVSTPVRRAIEEFSAKRQVFDESPVVDDLRLYPHQNEGVRFLLNNYNFNGGKFRALLADDPRLGKSVQALAALRQSPPGTLLVLCPKPLLLQWVQYVSEWLLDDTAQQEFDLCVLEGNEKQRTQQLETFFKFPAKGRWKVVVSNWESLYMTKLNLVGRKWDYFLGDEAHRLKNRKSRISNAVKQLNARSMLLLSATFVENWPADWFNPLNTIESTVFGSYWRWCGHYIKARFDSYGIEFSEVKDTDVLRDHVAPYILQRHAESVADMPEKLHEVVLCSMDSWHEEFYRRLEKATRVELSEGTLAIPNVVSRLTRLRQAAVHPALLDPALKEKGYETGKLATLLSLFENVVPADEQAIVYSSFVEGCQAAARVLGDFNTFVYAGEHNNASDIEKFQQGEHRVMLATPQKGGVGLNLYNANYVVFLDVPWSTIALRQAEERVRAIGKKGPVYVLTLALANTVDSYVAQRVASKLANVSESDAVALAREYLS